MEGTAHQSRVHSRRLQLHGYKDTIQQSPCCQLHATACDIDLACPTSHCSNTCSMCMKSEADSMPQTRPCSPSHSGALAMPARQTCASSHFSLGSCTAQCSCSEPKHMCTAGSLAAALLQPRPSEAVPVFLRCCACCTHPCCPRCAVAAPCSCSAWKAWRMGRSTSSSTTLPLSGISSYAAVQAAGRPGRAG